MYSVMPVAWSIIDSLRGFRQLHDVLVARYFCANCGFITDVDVLFQVAHAGVADLKGALSRYFSVILHCRNMFLHRWKPENNDAALLSL